LEINGKMFEYADFRLMMALK